MCIRDRGSADFDISSLLGSGLLIEPDRVTDRVFTSSQKGERQRQRLDPGGDQVGRGVARQVGDPAKRRLHDHTTVSYTHLDVYKRQVSTSSRSSGTVGLRGPWVVTR